MYVCLSNLRRFQFLSLSLTMIRNTNLFPKNYSDNICDSGEDTVPGLLIMFYNQILSSWPWPQQSCEGWIISTFSAAYFASYLLILSIGILMLAVTTGDQAATQTVSLNLISNCCFDPASLIEKNEQILYKQGLRSWSSRSSAVFAKLWRKLHIVPCSYFMLFNTYNTATFTITLYNTPGLLLLWVYTNM